MKIPLNEIATLHRQRKDLDPKELSALAESIKANGLLHPIVVRPPFEEENALITEEQRFVLCVGGRRLAAHYILGSKDIEANLKSDLDPLSAEICELEENLVRVDISYPDEVAARARMHEIQKKINPGQTLAQTAELIKTDAPQLSRDIALHNAIKLDPSLAKASTKGSAIRMAAHKDHVKKREASVVGSIGTDLKSKLFTADGRDFIGAIPSQSIDLVFSDLPYGIGYFEGAKSGQDMKGQYDDDKDVAKKFIAAVIPDMIRVIKPTGWIVLFMCYEWHGWLQDEIAKAGLKPELPPWIWTRRGKGNHGHWPELHASNRYELIIVVNGGQAHLIKTPSYPYENVLDFEPMSGPRLHAMQKPHDLCREIIGRTTVVGEKVLDICMGSGAHLAAAADMGRDFLGCDNNSDNLPAAVALVSQYYHRKS